VEAKGCTEYALTEAMMELRWSTSGFIELESNRAYTDIVTQPSVFFFKKRKEERRGMKKLPFIINR